MNEPSSTGAPRWWAEAPFWLVVCGLTAVLLPRMGAVPMRGEEHGWAEVAVEMRHFDDWVVPRLYGDPYLTRPPLHPWLIAASESAFGSLDRWVVRLPSALAVVLTAGLLYAYARQFFGRAGAVAAALVYPTFGEVVTQAQQAETEPVYVLFLAGSLIIWHWGYCRKWRPAVTWSAAYGLAALACLCKGGLQPPVYLCGTIGVYLVWKRDVRFALSRGHLAGACVGVAVAAAWAVPCAERVGWATTKLIWMSDTSSRFAGWTPAVVLKHLAEFPAEVFASLLPWSLLAPAYLVPAARRAVAAGRPCVGFCGLAFGLAVLTIWIPPGGRTRYLAPLYPCLAVALGAVADAASHPAVRRAWQRFLWSAALLVGLVALAVVGARFALTGVTRDAFSFPPLATGAYAALLFALAALVAAAARREPTPRAVSLGVWAIAASTALIIVGPLTDSRVARTNDIQAAVEPIRERLTAEEPVVSLGRVHASVPYFLRRPVPNKAPEKVAEVPPGGYFCVNFYRQLPQLPFEWERVGVVSVDRFRSEQPKAEVLIGRRLNGADRPR